ncbi:MAG: DUF1963 domain-containing protein [Pseudomonadota bacterium]
MARTGAAPVKRALFAGGAIASWIGGGLRAIPSFEWPWVEARPLNLVATIALADLPRAAMPEVFPKQGLLLFFVDIEGPRPGTDTLASAVRLIDDEAAEAQTPPLLASPLWPVDAVVEEPLKPEQRLPPVERLVDLASEPPRTTALFCNGVLWRDCCREIASFEDAEDFRYPPEDWTDIQWQDHPMDRPEDVPEGGWQAVKADYHAMLAEKRAKDAVVREVRRRQTPFYRTWRDRFVAAGLARVPDPAMLATYLSERQAAMRALSEVRYREDTDRPSDPSLAPYLADAF